MKVINRKINKVYPYPNNPRINAGAIDAVATSIKEYGWKQPIVVDREFVIVVGHTRYEAARKLGMKEVPVLVAEDLTDDQIKAYRIADNKSSENSEWDMDLLKLELTELDLNNYDIALTGFSQNDIKVNDDLNCGEDDLPDIDKEVPAITKPGDIYEMGKHILVCGDALSPATYRNSFPDPTRLCITDPPYEMDACDQSRAILYSGAVAAAVMGSGKQIYRFIDLNEWIFHWDILFYRKYKSALTGDGALMPAMIHTPVLELNQPEIEEYEDDPLTVTITRDKHKLGFSRKRFAKMTGTHKNVVEMEFTSRKIHSDAKPVSALRALVYAFRDETIFDPFTGFGSTMIACEIENKTFRGIELSEHNCDLIVERWQNFTGKKAQRRKLRCQ